MRRFRRECGLKKARILRERLILVSQGLKIGINRQPLFLQPFCSCSLQFSVLSDNKPYDTIKKLTVLEKVRH